MYINFEMNTPPIDKNVLNALRELQIAGKPNVLVRIVNAYLEGSESLVAKLPEALAAGYFDVVKKTAHSLKSSSANVGALNLSGLSKELEMLDNNKTFDNATDLVSAIESEFVRVKVALIKEISSAC